jgi:hypothetical protein
MTLRSALKGDGAEQTESKRPRLKRLPIMNPIGPSQRRRQIQPPNLPEMRADQHQQKNLERDSDPLAGSSVRNRSLGNLLSLRLDDGS